MKVAPHFALTIDDSDERVELFDTSDSTPPLRLSQTPVRYLRPPLLGRFIPPCKLPPVQDFNSHFPSLFVSENYLSYDITTIQLKSVDARLYACTSKN